MIVAELHAGDVRRSSSGAMTGTLYLKLGDHHRRCPRHAASMQATWVEFE
jgi:hypothetical protein